MNNDPWKFIVKYASIMPLNLSPLRAMFEVEFLLFGETNIGSMNLDCAQIRRVIFCLQVIFVVLSQPGALSSKNMFEPINHV